MPAPAAQEPSAMRHAFWLVLLTALSSAAVVLLLFTQSLRLDEAQSLFQVAHPPARLIQLIAEDVHVPLYHLMLHGFELLFADTFGPVIAGRLFSLTFFALTIPAVYLLSRAVYGRQVALFSAALASFSPFLAWYGSEIRMYSLLGFWTVLNQYAFIMLFHGQRLPLASPTSASVKAPPAPPQWRYWILYAATAVAGMMTHYFFALVLVTQVLFVVMNRSLYFKHAFRRFMGAAVAVGLALLPWVYLIFRYGGIANTRPQLTPPTAQSIFNTYAEFFFGFSGETINTLVIATWPLVMLYAFLALGRRAKLTPMTKYLFLGSSVPLLAAFLLSVFLRPFYESRFLIIAIPSLYLIVSWLFHSYADRVGKFAKVAVLSAMALLFVHQAVSLQNPAKEPFREIVAYVDEHGTAQDIIVVSPPFLIYPVEFYHKGPMTIETVPDWNRLVRGPLPEFDDDRVGVFADELGKDHRIIWVVLGYDQGYEDGVISSLSGKYQRVLDQPFGQSLRLQAYEADRDPVDYRAALTPLWRAAANGAAEEGQEEGETVTASVTSP